MKTKFLTEKRVNEGHSLSSLNSYNSLFYHIEESKILDLENFKTFTLNNVLEFFQKKAHKWTDSTYNFYIKKMRVFLKFLYREGIISNFESQLRFKKQDKKLPKYIKNSELAKIYSILTEEEQRIIKFFLYTGVRRFEFAGISEKNINLKRREIIIFGKGRKERIIPIHPALMDDIKKMNFPYNLYEVDQLRRKIQKKFPTFKLHNLRHTFATTMIRARVPIYTVSQIMGHGNIDTTTIYLSLDSSSATREIKKISFDFIEKIDRLNLNNTRG